MSPGHAGVLENLRILCWGEYPDGMANAAPRTDTRCLAGFLEVIIIFTTKVSRERQRRIGLITRKVF